MDVPWSSVALGFSMQQPDELTTSIVRRSRASPRVKASKSRSNGRPHPFEDDSVYRAYFENTSEGLFIIDVMADGRFLFRELNPVHEQLTGLPTATLLGRTPHECLSL